jgi:hypothetical protein
MEAHTLFCRGKVLLIDLKGSRNYGLKKFFEKDVGYVVKYRDEESHSDYADGYPLISEFNINNWEGGENDAPHREIKPLVIATPAVKWRN